MDQETDKAILQFVKEASDALKGHKASLVKINENLVACHKAMEKQAGIIIDFQETLDAHGQAIAKLLAKVFPDEAGQVMKKMPLN